MDFKTGGQEVIKRLLEVYGFSSRQALAAHLGVSAGTMGTRWMRDFFPADWVIQCAIETGASVAWLSFGKGEIFLKHRDSIPIETADSTNDNALNDVIAVPRKKIVSGQLYESNFYMLDKAVYPEGIDHPFIIQNDDERYLVEQKFNEISDGTWLVEIEGNYSIRHLTRVPVGKIKVDGPSTSFECLLDEINPIGKCIYKIMVKI